VDRIFIPRNRRGTPWGREDRLHQRGISLLEKHIEQFGKDIAALNDELRRRAQDVALA
jgi:hypothetical protein